LFFGGTNINNFRTALACFTLFSVSFSLSTFFKECFSGQTFLFVKKREPFPVEMEVVTPAAAQA
jgi:hypothetical protein